MKQYHDTRDATFEELYAIARRDPRVVVLTADTGAFMFKEFQKNTPEQFYNVGVSEQNAVSAAAGLALSGLKVFLFGISNFLVLRCFEQIKIDIASMGLDVTLLGMNTGYGYSIDGPTHHITEDITLMRTLPGMTVWSPSDCTMAGACIRLAYETPGPKFIRVDKGPFAPIYDPSVFDFGQGFTELKTGSKNIVIVATGIMVPQAMRVSQELAQNELDVDVIDLYRLKPVDIQKLSACLDGRRVVTLEEHRLTGGLSSLICEILADADRPTPVLRIGIGDVFRFEVGSRDWLRSLDGLDVETIAKRILNWVKEKHAVQAARL